MTLISPMRKRIRIGLAQMNPAVGDLPGNAEKIRSMIAEAKRRGVRILGFPELMLCGYPPEDLLLKPRFLGDCEKSLAATARSARGIAVLVGAPEPSSRGSANPYNTCAVLHRGEIAARYRKMHLPNYGVFDEKRYFEQGREALVVRFGALPVGINICEDIWADDGPTGLQAGPGGARIVFNISASPYHRRKGPERERLMQRRAREHGCYVAYVNLIGGQDELVFDGSSVIVGPNGKTIARGRPFEEDLVLADIDLEEGTGAGRRPSSGPRRLRSRDAGERERTGTGARLAIIDLGPLSGSRSSPPMRKGKPKHLKPAEEIYRALMLGTQDYVEKNRFKGVVLGLSGGIDSALTAAIAVDALGAERVMGLTMPSPYTSSETLADSRRLARNLGIRLFEIPIHGIFQEYLDALAETFSRTRQDVTEENLQARIRGNLLMALSNKFGWLVLATGNKSEIAVGYCTLYGDTAGGFAVLKDVPKTLVYTLSRYRNRIAGRAVIPRSTIARVPTAELRPGQCDQDTLPPYPLLDRIIELYVERDMAAGEIVSRGLDADAVNRTVRMIDSNEYKRRQGPPGIKITPKAFGRDRRLPITNRYRGSESKSRRRNE
jgi:NAD+ synthase (glutamine-hydrolysing)